MKSAKSSSKKCNLKEIEARQVIKCLRRRLAWCNHNNTDFNVSNEQYSLLPRAIADEDGNPHKSNKSSWTDKLSSRYSLANPQVFTSQLPFVPQVVIIDAMFLINMRPLRQTKTITDYTKLLFNQFILL